MRVLMNCLDRLYGLKWKEWVCFLLLGLFCDSRNIVVFLFLCCWGGEVVDVYCLIFRGCKVF